MSLKTGWKNAMAADRAIREYEESADPGLVEFIERVRSVPAAEADKLNYKISVIGDRQRSGIEALTGETLNAAFNFFKGSEINHIDYRHGRNGVADHTMANIEDMARVGYILANYDKIHLLKDEYGEIVTSDNYRTRDGKLAPMLLFVKRINGFYCVAQAVNDSSKGRLNVISAYRSKTDPLKN